MNIRSWLKNYMKEKSDMIKEITGISLYEKIDYYWVDNLTYDDLRYIKWNLKENINYSHEYDDFIRNSFCPQCLIYVNDCANCDYSKYNGPRGRKDTKWSKIDIKIEKYLECENFEYLNYLLTYIKWN